MAIAIGDTVRYEIVGAPMTKVVTPDNIDALKAFIAVGGEVTIVKSA